MPSNLVSTLAWVAAAAVLATMIAAVLPRRVLPVIVAEILLGIVAGPSGLNLIAPNEVLTVLSWLGFAMLMFVSGMEIDLKVLVTNAGGGARSGPRYPLAWSAGIVLGTFALSAGGVLAIFGSALPVSHLLFIALVLSTTSVGIVVPTLKERGLTTGAYGQIILASAILADFLTMMLVSVLAAWIAGGSLAHSWLPALFVVVTAVAGMIIVRFARKSAVREYMSRLNTPTGRLPMRAAFALLFVLAAVAEHMGAEFVLAAFLAGIIVGALVPRGTAIPLQLEFMGFGFLIPMFFFSVGVGFDLPALLGSQQAIAALPALIVLAYANKIIPVIALRRYFSWNEVTSAGVLLSARLSLIIAAAAIGVRLEVLDPALNSAMILLAVFTAIVSPIVFNVLAAPPGAHPQQARRPDA